MPRNRNIAEVPWSTVSSAMHCFIDILRNTWFNPDGWDSDGDDLLDLLVEVPEPTDPELAKLVNQLTENYRVYVANDHRDPRDPDRTGQNLFDEAKAILAYIATHP